MADSVNDRAGDRATIRLAAAFASEGSEGPPLPGADQTPETVERWVARAAIAGMIVVVRHAQQGLCEYHLDEVARLNSAARRIYLVQHGAFGFDGTGVAGARGQLTLLEPTPDVLDAAVKGKTWQRGYPAFKRPLSPQELFLAAQLGDSRD